MQIHKYTIINASKTLTKFFTKLNYSTSSNNYGYNAS